MPFQEVVEAEGHLIDSHVMERIFDKVAHVEMPPKKQPQPGQKELRPALAWLSAGLHQASASRQASEGRVIYRRLNRTEYENTVRDLLGVERGHLIAGETQEVQLVRRVHLGHRVVRQGHLGEVGVLHAPEHVAPGVVQGVHAAPVAFTQPLVERAHALRPAHVVVPLLAVLEQVAKLQRPEVGELGPGKERLDELLPLGGVGVGEERPLGLAPIDDPPGEGRADARQLREFRLARELGFATAVTTRKGLIFDAHEDHLTALPRLSLSGDYQKPRYVEVLLSGAPFLLFNGLRRVKTA